MQKPKDLQVYTYTHTLQIYFRGEFLCPMRFRRSSSVSLYSKPRGTQRYDTPISQPRKERLRKSRAAAPTAPTACTRSVSRTHCVAALFLKQTVNFRRLSFRGTKSKPNLSPPRPPSAHPPGKCRVTSPSKLEEH